MDGSIKKRIGNAIKMQTQTWAGLFWQWQQLRCMIIIFLIYLFMITSGPIGNDKTRLSKIGQSQITIEPVMNSRLHVVWHSM